MPKPKFAAPVNVRIVCEICAGMMKLARIIPPAMALPELHTFHCSDCGSLQTVHLRADQTKVAA